MSRTTTISSKVRTIIFAVILTPAAWAIGPKTDTIKSADFPGGGFRVGDTIRATFVMTGNGSGAYNRTAVAVEGPNGGPIQVTFEKPPTGATIMYTNTRTGRSMSTIFKSTNGQIGQTGGEEDIIPLIHVGDLYPLLAHSDGSLNTWTDLDSFVNNTTLMEGQIFTFSNGACSLLPGTFVLDDNGGLYTGTAQIGAFNEVGLVPTPGTAALATLAFVTATRRKRS